MSLLLLLLACGPAADPAEVPTWAEDVKPIVDASCVSCHSEGGAGGFSLDSYEALSLLGPAAAEAVTERRMPPWMPDNDCREYVDDRSLSQGEIDTLVAWVEGGMPEGDPALAEDSRPSFEPLAPTHSATTPAYLPSTEGSDEYRCFVLDVDTSEPLYLSATDVEPGSGQVHHVLIYGVDAQHAPAIEAADGADGQPGYACYGNPLPPGSPLGLPTQLGAWVPGGAPARLPEGTSTRVEAGMKVVMQMHYSALGGAAEPDQTTWHAVMSTEPTAQLQVVRPLLYQELDIPAGERAEFSVSYPYYGDAPVQISAAMAHMHLLGERFEAWVERAQGDDECLLVIPDWDFEWQQSYALPEGEGLLVGDGDRVGMTCAYDNTAENQPLVDGEPLAPRDVEWGDGSLDEMCLLYLTRVEPFTPPADPEALPCEGFDACLAECDDPSSFDCVLSCEAVADDCATCALTEVLECAAPSCGLSLLAAQDCLRTCAVSTAMLGSNLGRCMEAECPDAYAGALECVDPLYSGDCAPAPDRCGL